jgi:CO/xanthine dehydrogenase FAD-binding subunit
MTNPTTYHRPESLAQAAELMRQPDALALAGGALTFGSLQLPYATLIDLQAIPELRRIDIHDSGMTYGAAVMLTQLVDILSVPLIFKRALTRCIAPNVLNNTSLGESIFQRDHILLREWMTALIVHDAGIETFFPTTNAKYWSDTDALFTEPPDANGFATALFIPHVGERAALGSAVVSRTPADAPIVNAAAYVRLAEDGTVETTFAAVGGASAIPVISFSLDNLKDSPLNEAAIASAAKSVIPQLEPVGDYLGSAEYRRDMARVCIARALKDCFDQVHS